MTTSALQAASEGLGATDWVRLIHPVLMILFVYPVVGATIRLGTLARERRLEINPLPPSVGVEHAEHGRWAATVSVVSVLIALLATAIRPLAADVPSVLGDPTVWPWRVLVSAAALAGCLALWRVRRPFQRAASALLCWAALGWLVSRPQAWSLGDDPLAGAFWRSHGWSGLLLCGLLLFAMAARAEILRSMAMRRLHVAAGVLVALLLAVLAITGCRDLLVLMVPS